jgi:hypothetical protein
MFDPKNASTSYRLLISCIIETLSVQQLLICNGTIEFHFLQFYFENSKLRLYLCLRNVEFFYDCARFHGQDWPISYSECRPVGIFKLSRKIYEAKATMYNWFYWKIKAFTLEKLDQMSCTTVYVIGLFCFLLLITDIQASPCIFVHSAWTLIFR